ncbi:MAG: protein-export membrane protein SecD [Candidatus Levybacteria bacterium RIFCSPHIGHO2_01_FULL_41_15]|nr:MAG: protein-export membrane protein SecD [Candidatus Levybacteria bacterium RIFCSPHIGHO2_01_FULL_41_15]
MRKPRFLFFSIIFLTLLAVFVDLPKISNLSIGPFKKINIDSSAVLRNFKINKEFVFRRGLDLEGGTSITFRANMNDIPSSQRTDALNSAKTIIERRVNLFGVSEPIVQTASVNGDSRIIVELPGVTDINQAISLIGTTAELSFWEEGATESAKIASPSALPLGVYEILGPNPKKTSLTGSDLQRSGVSFDPNTGSPQVQLIFTSDGAKKFADITKRNVDKIVAIVLDNQVIQAPRVSQPILTGDAVITGKFILEDAKLVSTQLNAGALPVPLSVLEQRVIGPTLGEESLKKSLFAGIIGFLIIVIFMIVLYGRLGTIASFALLIYALLVLSIFKISNVTPYGITLTLSGIAGFILSIGMAVDANILIFERIKEEKRQGKRNDVATEIGFSRAWTSIRDSNISTLITSIVLYQFGTGIVKGFALVLAIGVLVSMFSAIIITRTFLRFLYEN